MEERPVIILAAALAASIVLAGVVLPAIGLDSQREWHSFDLSMASEGEASVGRPVNVSVSLRQGAIDPRSLWMVFLSLDVEDAQVLSATPGSNPWGYPTIWNVTQLDLTEVQVFRVTIAPTVPGGLQLRATVWTPRADVGGVPVEPNGHVNPAGVSIYEAQSLYLVVASAP